MIELNVFQHLATSPGRDRPFKNHTNPFLNDPNCKREVFGHFQEFGLMNRLDIAYCDRTQCFSPFIEVLIVIKMMEMRFEYAFI